MTRSLFLFFGFLLPYIAYGEACDSGKDGGCTLTLPTYIAATYSTGNSPPIYPQLSLRLGEEGTVLLKVLITADGKTGTVEIMKSSGFERLDASAIEAVNQWRFNPATVDGKHIDVWYQIPVSFKTIKNEGGIPTPADSSECLINPTSWEKFSTNGLVGEYSTSWKKILTVRDSYIKILGVKKFGKLKVEPKGLVDRFLSVLSLEDFGTVFLLAENNVKLSEIKTGSKLSLRFADCANKELLVQAESIFTCPFGEGLELPSAYRGATHLNNWLKVSPGSRDDSMLRFVCTK